MLLDGVHHDLLKLLEIPDGDCSVDGEVGIASRRFEGVLEGRSGFGKRDSQGLELVSPERLVFEEEEYLK